MPDTLYENNTTGTVTGTITSSAVYACQTFTPGTDHTITSVDLKVSKYSGTTGNLVVSIRATSSGEPTGDDLCSGSVAIASLPADGAADWVNFDFGDGTSLESGVVYAIIARTTYHSFRWVRANTGDNYADGTAGYSLDYGSSWTMSTSGQDYTFKEYGIAYTSTLQDYYNTGDSSDLSVYGDNYYAQTFTPSVDYALTSIKLKLWKATGNSPGTLTLGLYAVDGSGHPTGSALATSTSDGDTLTTTQEWREFSLSQVVSLSAGTKYAIVLDARNGDSDNKALWRFDLMFSPYTGGACLRSTDAGSSWSTQGTTSADAMFECYGIISLELSGQSGISLTPSGSLTAVKPLITTATIVISVEGVLSAVPVPVAASVTVTITTSGDLSVSKTLGAQADIVFVTGGALFEGLLLVPRRPIGYDEDAEWDEDTNSWISVESVVPPGGGRWQHPVVVVNDQGNIYYGDIT